jgi:enoyl-CoA hydratase/carnithine racemase
MEIDFILLTFYFILGNVITGKEAKAMGLITESVPKEKLDEYVLQLANRHVI